MKLFIKFILIFILLLSSVKATTFDVLVLPADIFCTKENFYGFKGVSEIIAEDVIHNFNSSGGKINSPDLYSVKNNFAKNPQLKNKIKQALANYLSTGKIDYQAFKSAADNFLCKSILIISSTATAGKNSKNADVWEVLDISSAFKISTPYTLETSLVLTDNVNNLVMWSGIYKTSLGKFSAKNYTEANEQYEKIKLYSQTVASPSASQNIMLRFFPKSVQPIIRDVKDSMEGTLRFERTLPEKPQKYIPPKEEFYGEMIYGI